MTFRKIAVCVLVFVALGIVSGCAKLTFERWQTLNTQSTKPEVEATLGTPNQYQKADRWMYHDPDRQVTCSVEFVGGDKLTYSQWVDPEHGKHEIGTAEIDKGNLIQRETGKTDINR